MSLLLTSVFRPFGVDDDYGRKENKLELFHNQVTREQGIFSMRYNHRSFGLYFIAENIKMPTVVLDFPNLKQFRKELKKGYDYVGISFITPNFIKAKKMAEIVREVAPDTKIILGGHGTRIPDIENLIDADHYISGEGIKQLRELFGEEPDAKIKHPVLPAADNKQILGLPISYKTGLLIPGVGCPNACRFCCTSHFFDREYTSFLKTGQEIFDTLVDISDKLNTEEFFVMDENFLLHKERAMELLDLMEKNGRTFRFSIFSSAEAVTAFGVENMLRLGISYLWLGVESKQSLFDKTKGIDVKKLISDIRSSGILVLASSILFLEHQTPENIWEDIDYAISLKPDFTQFMQLGPLPQTKLYLDYKEKGLLREDIPYEEWHGQHRLWFDHPEFTPEQSENILRDAFKQEFLQLGPSILRAVETAVRGLDSPAYKTDDPFMRERYQQEVKKCKTLYLATKVLKWMQPTPQLKQYAQSIIEMYEQKFGAPGPLNWMASIGLYSLTRLTKLKLALGVEAHNPPMFKTMFRLTPSYYKEMMKGRIQAILRSRKAWAFLENKGEAFELSMHFSGKIKETTVNALMKRLNKRPEFSLKSVKINITPLADFNEEIFEKFIERLHKRCTDIRIYCSETQQRHVNFFNKLTSKNVCSVNKL